MAIITNDNKVETKKNSINELNLNQLDTVINSNSKNSVKHHAPEESSSKPAKKREYTDTVVINLPKGERSTFKAFCAQNNLTMTDYIYFAMDFIKTGVETGKFTVGRSGIKEL